jgi:NADPH-dependent glutamate synthase beta subunit-like oxidoreductase
VADLERETGQRVQPYKAPATDRKVAVIGGGVEGLSAAFFMARLGHSPVIFEAGQELGGLLRTAIPPSRLPREVLDWEIEGILQMGVEARMGQLLGRDFGLSSLLEEGFEAVHLATGGWDASLLRGDMTSPQTALPGLFLLLPLTLAWAAGKQVDLGEHAVIVGAGKKGLHLAYQCLEHGAQKVTVLWRRKRDDIAIDDQEFAQARDKGVSFAFNVKVMGLGGQGDRLSRLTYTTSSEEPGDLREVDLDSLIVASGRAPGLIIRPSGERDEEGKLSNLDWESVLPYHRAGQPGRGLFTNHEPVSDFKAAVEAIGSGRRAASSVNQLLSGEPVSAPANMLGPDSKLIDVDKLINLAQVDARQPMPTAEQEAILSDPSVEVELGLSEEAARKEAGRCLNCGLICYQRTTYR